MPTPYTPKRRHTDNTLPTTADLVPNEICVDTTDRLLYVRDEADNIIALDGVSSHNSINHGHIHRPTVTTDASTQRRMSLTDENSIVLFTNGSDVVVEVADHATIDYPVGYIAHVHQSGLGELTVTPMAGVTINSSRSLITGSQYSALSLMCVGVDTWVVVGDQQ